MEKHRSIPRTNFTHIEFILRTESNKLRTLKTASIDSIQWPHILQAIIIPLNLSPGERDEYVDRALRHVRHFVSTQTAS